MENVDVTDVQFMHYLGKFLKTVREDVIDQCSVPVAYVILYAEPGPHGTTLFKYSGNASHSMLPKGAEEVTSVLYKGIEAWIKENYPDSDVHTWTGEQSIVRH